ncbi:MAG: Rhodanese- sulfurtransferase [Bathelium mastoideum]|nr:MAG: Rhodanese- sulfurtransferase [Bathelium mastoideum]
MEAATANAEVDEEGGVSLSILSRVQSKPKEEADVEMFDGFEDELAEDGIGEDEEGGEHEGSEEEDDDDDDDDDVEMSATLEQTDLADRAEENIERAGEALPQYDPEATWIPPPESTASQNELYTSKPTPYTFDLGNLAVFDPNPLPPNPTTHDLDTTARAAAQSLIASLLTTCPIRRAATSNTNTSVLIQLPAPSTPLPREKRLPAAKPQTKWQAFAAKKGIAPGGKARGKEGGGGGLVYDEERKEWVPKWGYRGKNKEAEEQWLVEVDAKKEAAQGQKEGEAEAGGPRREGRAARKERVKRNERKMRANARKAEKGRGLAS